MNYEVYLNGFKNSYEFQLGLLSTTALTKMAFIGRTLFHFEARDNEVMAQLTKFAIEVGTALSKKEMGKFLLASPTNRAGLTVLLLTPFFLEEVEVPEGLESARWLKDNTGKSAECITLDAEDDIVFWQALRDFVNDEWGNFPISVVPEVRHSPSYLSLIHNQYLGEKLSMGLDPLSWVAKVIFNAPEYKEPIFISVMVQIALAISAKRLRPYAAQSIGHSSNARMVLFVPFFKENVEKSYYAKLGNEFLKKTFGNQPNNEPLDASVDAVWTPGKVVYFKGLRDPSGNKDYLAVKESDMLDFMLAVYYFVKPDMLAVDGLI